MADYKKILNFLKLDSIFEDLTAIVETKVELLKIELKEEVAKAVTKLIGGLFFGIMVFFIIIFLSITIATFINHWLSSTYIGFAIVTLFYLLLLIAYKIFNVGQKLETLIESSITQLNEPTEGDTSEEEEEINE